MFCLKAALSRNDKDDDKENTKKEESKRSRYLLFFASKVEKILKGSLDSIPSPSPWMKIQIIGWKV